MTVVPKVALLFFLAAASMHQGDALFSWKPAWKLWPLYEVGHPHSWQGPSSPAVRNVWNDLDEVWPVTRSLIDRYPKSMTVSQQRCGGGWVQYDDNNEIDNKLNTEERQLQLRENQLRKEREDLQRRRDDHERQKRQERRLEEQRRILEEEERRREKFRQQQELRAREERHRLEEQRRVERQREELKRKMKEERQIRQQEQRVKEERQRLEAQRRLEKERLAARKMEEERETRRRLAEENELRKRQQQDTERERRMQKQRRKQTEQESQPHPSMPKSQIATVNIPEGYDLKDIIIETIGNQIFVKGRHVCSCEENCFEREFERRTSLPNNVDTRTLTASLHPGERIYIQGVKHRRVVSPVDTMVTVEGVGLPQKQRTSDSTCKSKKAKKTGFRLKKMNARTGEIFDDIEPIEETYPLYESEVDEDGLTIEVFD